MMQRVDGANMPWLASDNGIANNAEGMFLIDYSNSFPIVSSTTVTVAAAAAFLLLLLM